MDNAITGEKTFAFSISSRNLWGFSYIVTSIIEHKSITMQCTKEILIETNHGMQYCS